MVILSVIKKKKNYVMSHVVFVDVCNSQYLISVVSEI